MGMRDEIEALPDARTAAGTPIAGTLDRSEVFRIIDKHAAPVVDMTKGGVLRIPVLPITEQDDKDLAAILAEHDRNRTRTPL